MSGLRFVVAGFVCAAVGRHQSGSRVHAAQAPLIPAIKLVEEKEEGGPLSMCHKGITELRAALKDAPLPLRVASIMGKPGEAKSTLGNKLVPTCFEVSNKELTHCTTHGVWAAVQPNAPGGGTLIILDVEGIFDMRKRGNQRLLGLSQVVSSQVIWNSKAPVPDTYMCEYLAAAGEIVSRNLKSLGLATPSLLWLARDYALVGTPGNLLDKHAPQPIRNMFSSLSFIPLPSFLEPKNNEAVTKLCHDISSQVPPKTVKGRNITGEQWLEMTQLGIESLIKGEMDVGRFSDGIDAIVTESDAQSMIKAVMDSMDLPVRKEVLSNLIRDAVAEHVPNPNSRTAAPKVARAKEYLVGWNAKWTELMANRLLPPEIDASVHAAAVARQSSGSISERVAKCELAGKRRYGAAQLPGDEEVAAKIKDAQEKTILVPKLSEICGVQRREVIDTIEVSAKVTALQARADPNQTRVEIMEVVWPWPWRNEYNHFKVSTKTVTAVKEIGIQNMVPGTARIVSHEGKCTLLNDKISTTATAEDWKHYGEVHRAINIPYNDWERYSYNGTEKCVARVIAEQWV